MIRKILLLPLVISMTVFGHAQGEDLERITHEHKKFEAELKKRPTIHGKDNPELIPEHVVLKHLFSNIEAWGADFTRQTFGHHMNISELKADKVFTLVDQAQEAKKQVPHQLSVCDFIQNKKAQGQSVSDKDMIAHYMKIKTTTNQLILDAGERIKKSLSPAEYKRFREYLNANLIPSIWYVPSEPNELLGRFKEPLAERHMECNSKQ